MKNEKFIAISKKNKYIMLMNGKPVTTTTTRRRTLTKK